MGRYSATEYVYSRDSSEKRGGFILFVMLVVGIVLAAFLLYYLSTRRPGVYSIVLVRGGEITTNMKVDDLQITAPGESSEYSIKVNCRDAGKYTFDFSFTGDATALLGPYVTVELFLNEEQNAFTHLDKLLAGETVHFEDTFVKSSTAVITIRYTMVEEVGNEVQGAMLDFNLVMKAKLVEEYEEG